MVVVDLVDAGGGVTQPAAHNRTAVALLDIGYVLAQAAKALLQRPDAKRRDVQLVDNGLALLQVVIEAVEEEHLQLLRVYWYDGARNRIPTPQQRAVGLEKRVKLRLGYLVGDTQKGVDRLICRDLDSLAAGKAVTDIILFSGDQDLAEEFDFAGQHGITMHLWSLAGEGRSTNQSATLLLLTDEWRAFPGTTAEEFVMDPLQAPGEAKADAEGASVESQHGDALVDASAASDNEVVKMIEQPEPDPLTDPETVQYRALGREAFDAMMSRNATHAEQQLTYMLTKRSSPNMTQTVFGETVRFAQAKLGHEVPRNTKHRYWLRVGFWEKLDEWSAAHPADQA